MFLVPALAVMLVGCNSGDTPVETMKVDQVPTKTDPMQNAIKSNPNMPDSAKSAILNGKK
ncbi:hypothetical protein OP10G_4700 [Fimbriimonas ginsengisoli Gsoil 348]|uniref:Uncharacterized protein n=1 Tax=Fimbriimonas ginsengisoli Gsoil 348 TaxID=661478 RepID=A0A068NX53_FIMGI|nr:hypothetical protein OP10G_4700 [Fimbriimonas ginsengisoli Gsoil 348]